MMTSAERIEEAHGLWELAIQRVAAMVELGDAVGWSASALTVLRAASTDERNAMMHWRAISDEALDDEASLK